MPQFEWDENKNKANKVKHKIAFEDAADVFNDKDRIKYASNRNNEKRYITIGKAYDAILTVVYSVKELIIRIISARRANPEERREYLINKFKKTDHERK